MFGLLAALVLLPTGAAWAAAPPPRLVRITADTTQTAGAQHATEVEPDADAAGSKVVATFQVGRYFGGGADAIGYSTSGDAGRTWRSGLVPGVTQASSPPGPAAAASDPAVAYDAQHRRWLIASLALFADRSVIFVSGSADGLAWDGPVTAVSYPPSPIAGTSLDKEWISCDNGPQSPFRGRCYLAYTDAAHDPDAEHLGSHIAVQSSSDGGQTWSLPVLLGVTANTVSPGVQPVVRPNGELVVVYFEDGVVRAVRSNDGGATFSAPERVAGLAFHQRPIESTRLRAFSLPSATVDRHGTVYAAWVDCRFRPDCTADDVVWSSSTGPGRWTTPRRVPVAPVRSAVDVALPDLAVDPRSQGPKARLALTYHTVNFADCTETTCLLDVYLVTSNTAGKRWTRPRRLDSRRMRLDWLAQTVSGRMVGDYVATVFAGTRVVSVHVQAHPPRGDLLDEAVYALSLARP